MLWLLYTLLETNFTETDLHNNPFGADSIPSIQWLDDSEMKKFDIDPDYERYYAEEMFKTRMQYLANLMMSNTRNILEDPMGMVI